MSNLAIVKDKVQRMLVDGLDLNVRLTSGGYQVPHDTTAVNIDFVDQESRVADQPSRVLVRCWATIVHHVNESPELYKWIAAEGHVYHFGHAAWIPYTDIPGQGLVVFEHTLLGDYLDLEELKAAVFGVASTANQLDEQIKERFGGKRFVDVD